jgi:hypothetical protein
MKVDCSWASKLSRDLGCKASDTWEILSLELGLVGLAIYKIVRVKWASLLGRKYFFLHDMEVTTVPMS